MHVGGLYWLFAFISNNKKTANVHLQCILTWRNMQPRVTAADRLVEIRIQHVALVHPVVLRVTRRQVCKVQIAWTKKHTSTREALI